MATLADCIIICALIIFAIADAANTFLHFQTNEYQKISIVPRILFEVIVFSFLIFRARISRVSFSLINIIIGLLGTFLIGFGTYQTINLDASWLVALAFFNKQLYFFICFIFVWEMRNSSKIFNQNKIARVYELVLYANGAAIIIGLIFNIHWLSSYGVMTGSGYREYRLGFKGFIPAVNEASLFWIIALFYSLFVLHDEKRIWPFLTSLSGCLLIGSKAAIFFGGFTLAAYFFMFYRKKAIISGIILIVFFLCAIPFITRVPQEYFRSLKMLSYFFYRADLGVNLWSILLSGRDTYITRAVENITNYWGPLNYLFGGQDRITYLVEMDFFDTPLFFGAIGSIIYLLGFSLIFIKIKAGFREPFIIVYFGMAILGGHVFGSALNSLYLTIFVIRAAQTPGARKNAALVPSVV